MTRALIRNVNRLEIQPIKSIYCISFGCQLRGLMFRPALGAYEGLLLVQRTDSIINAAIHMLGMSFDICVIWINSEFQVVDKCIARRWHPIYLPKIPARYVLEAHLERKNEYHIGETIEISLIPDR